MENRMDLPVNKSHHIRSGTTFAGLYSIMTSEEYTGKLNAVISNLNIYIDDELQNNRECCHDSKHVDLEIDDKENILKFSSHPFIEKKYGYVFKQVEKSDNLKVSMEMKVEYLQDANAWTNAKLVLSGGINGYDHTYKEATFDNECSLRLTAKGKLVFHSAFCHKVIQIRKTDEAQAIYLRLDVGCGCCAKYSFDGEVWQVLYESETDVLEFKELGVYVSPKISPFFFEFFPSHLQLCFSKATKVLMPHTETEDRNFTELLEVYTVPSEAIHFPGNNLVDYFMELLSKKYYVRLRLNEFYLPETPSYKKLDFAHVNYLYGYDKERRVFKVIGYNRYLMFTEISFEDFELAIKYEKHLKDKVTLYKYNSVASIAEFPVKAVISNLTAYLNGSNSYLVKPDKTIVNDTSLPFVYGLKIFEAMAENPEYIESFVRDVRLTYKIQERYLIIKNMLELMKHLELLAEEDYKKYFEKFQVLFQLVESLKEMIVKHYLKAIPDIHEKIKEILLDLKEKDEQATVELVCDLEKFLENKEVVE